MGSWPRLVPAAGAVLVLVSCGTASAGTEHRGETYGVRSGSLTAEVVTFDRPFLLLLTDTETNSPLFLTVVTDPSR